MNNTSVNVFHCNSFSVDDYASGYCECGHWLNEDWSYCPKCGKQLNWSKDLPEDYVYITKYFLDKLKVEPPKNTVCEKIQNYGQIIYETEKAYRLSVRVQYYNYNLSKHSCDSIQIWVPKSQTGKTEEEIQKQEDYFRILYTGTYPTREEIEYHKTTSLEERVRELEEEIEWEKNKNYMLDQEDEGDNCAPGIFGWLYSSSE